MVVKPIPSALPARRRSLAAVWSGLCAVLLAWLGLGTPGPVVAAAPPNDLCSGALVVPAAGPFPYLTPVVEVSCAGTVGDPTVPPTCGDTNASRSVWYRFTPSASGAYVFSVGADTATDFGGPDLTDTVLAIYTGPSCGGPLTLLGCNDDSGLLQSALSLNLTAGTPCYAVVWVGASTLYTNQLLKVQLRVSSLAPPVNDACAGAVTIPASGPFPHLTSVVDMAGATSTGEPGPSCAYDRGVWFKFTPAVSGTYLFSTDTDTATTVYDTSLALFTNVGGCGGTFTALDCVDNVGSRFRASLARALTAGVTVYLLVWDYEVAPIFGETSLQLRVSLAGPPTVATLPATSIASTSAVLNATVAPNTLTSRFFLEWGPTTNYGNATASRLITGSLTNLTQPRSETLTGLTPGLTYHYRAVGSNAQGKVFGLNQSFTIATNPPVLTAQTPCPGGAFLVQFNGNAGRLYLVQGSSNLTQWADLGPARDLGGGAFDYLHVPGTLPPYRFYKVRTR